MIDSLEAAAGLECGFVGLIPWIETARGIVNAYEICSASPRIMAAGFGAEDFTNDMEIERTHTDDEIAYPQDGGVHRGQGCPRARAGHTLLQVQGHRRPETRRAEGEGNGLSRQVRYPSGPGAAHRRGILPDGKPSLITPGV